MTLKKFKKMEIEHYSTQPTRCLMGLGQDCKTAKGILILIWVFRFMPVPASAMPTICHISASFSVYLESFKAGNFAQNVYTVT